MTLNNIRYNYHNTYVIFHVFLALKVKLNRLKRNVIFSDVHSKLCVHVHKSTVLSLT